MSAWPRARSCRCRSTTCSTRRRPISRAATASAAPTTRSGAMPRSACARPSDRSKVREIARHARGLPRRRSSPISSHWRQAHHPMQHYGLTLDKFVDHAAKWHGAATITTAVRGVAARRAGYAEVRARSNRLSGALLSLGLSPGDRVGTLAWNTQHHLEVYYATMNAGLVCHTLNPRLTTAHLAAMIIQADDKVLALAASLMPLLSDLLPLCPTLERIIVLDGFDEAAASNWAVPV